jgi:hypothetical protein
MVGPRGPVVVSERKAARRSLLHFVVTAGSRLRKDRVPVADCEMPRSGRACRQGNELNLKVAPGPFPSGDGKGVFIRLQTNPGHSTAPESFGTLVWAPAGLVKLWPRAQVLSPGKSLGKTTTANNNLALAA